MLKLPLVLEDIIFDYLDYTDYLTIKKVNKYFMEKCEKRIDFLRNLPWYSVIKIDNTFFIPKILSFNMYIGKDIPGSFTIKEPGVKDEVFRTSNRVPEEDLSVKNENIFVSKTENCSIENGIGGAVIEKIMLNGYNSSMYVYIEKYNQRIPRIVISQKQMSQIDCLIESTPTSINYGELGIVNSCTKKHRILKRKCFSSKFCTNNKKSKMSPELNPTIS